MVHTLLQHIDAPNASLRMLCAFVAMHMAIKARSGNPPAQPAQMQAVVEKVLHVLVLPAGTVTVSGETSVVVVLCSDNSKFATPLIKHSMG